MGRVLFTWELGGGLGHLMQILPLARGLARRGHRIFVAVRDHSRSCNIFSEQEGITLLPTPARITGVLNAIRPPRTLAHIFHNVGHDNLLELAGMTAAWRGLFDVVGPDVIVFDHSPTALLAARGLSVSRVILGAGFFCPPDQHPLPDLRPWMPGDPQKMRSDELELLERWNRLLEARKQPPLERLTQLYSAVDDTFLVTFRELDHYLYRPHSPAYRGVWMEPGGSSVTWPRASGKKVYAYLKNFPALGALLDHLRERALPTLVFADGVPPELRERYSGATLSFATKRPDMKQIAAECDVAILNANHATSAALLLACKPLLQLPIYLEQGIFAAATCRLGAAVQASIEQPDEVTANFAKLLDDQSYGDAARRFAEQYADFDAKAETETMVQRIETLAF